VPGPVMIEVTYHRHEPSASGTEVPGPALSGLAEDWGRSHHVGQDVLWALIR
jgi:hypothetical protein